MQRHIDQVHRSTEEVVFSDTLKYLLQCQVQYEAITSKLSIFMLSVPTNTNGAKMWWGPNVSENNFFTPSKFFHNRKLHRKLDF